MSEATSKESESVCCKVEWKHPLATGFCNAIARSAGFANFLVDDPGVSLRFTPGYTLTSAPRTKNRSQKAEVRRQKDSKQ